MSCCKVICTSDIWTDAELSKPVYLDAKSFPISVIWFLRDNGKWLNGKMDEWKLMVQSTNGWMD